MPSFIEQLPALLRVMADPTTPHTTKELWCRIASDDWDRHAPTLLHELRTGVNDVKRLVLSIVCEQAQIVRSTPPQPFLIEIERLLTDDDRLVRMAVPSATCLKPADGLVSVTAAPQEGRRALDRRGSPAPRPRTAASGADCRNRTGRLRTRASRSRATPRHRGLGVVSRHGVGEDKISLYQASTVFALPTSQENFGFVFYEALAAGCPVITTRGVDTWPELARAGATIIDQDARQLADAIDHITRDREQREQLGTRGRGWVLENLDPASLTHRYAEFYARATT
jgi:glycosyltransferase involved in cell wall biosynthesis